MAARRVRPPRVARFLVGAVVRDPIREYLLGDLEEQFARTAANAPGAAWRDYWRQALRILLEARALRRPARRPAVAAASRSRSEGMRNLWRDVRLGLRTALRSPGYSTITALTLALAIGANTLLFSIANPLLVRGLPLQDPDTLGWVYASNAEREITRGLSALPDYLEWRAAMKSFTELAAYEIASGTLTGHGDAKRVVLARTSANLPKVWGLQPGHGRLFQPGEDAPGREAVGILSYRYLHEQFEGNPAVIGQTYLIDGAPITIVGVMPKAIEIGNLALVDIWTPLPLDPSAARDRRALRVVGRLAPGATVTSADAELQPILDAQRRDHPVVTAGWQSHVTTTNTALAASDTWVILGLLGVVVVFVLLIACANLANLVLARLIARRQESAVRLALGASRWQLVRPLLSESLILSLIGGLAGLGLATAGLRLITATAYEPYMRALEIDRNVLVFTLLLSLATPLLFTLWPAISAGRSVTADILHGSRTSGGRVASRRRNILVAGQVALALSLLVLSALVVQSMIHLRRINLGMDLKPLLTYRFDLPKARYPDTASQARFVQTLEQELQAIPGANGAAIATHMPVFESEFVQRMSGTLHDGQTDEERPWASCFAVTPGFFQTSGIQLLKGRTFEPGDRAGAAGVAIISRLSAERYFDGVDNALSRTVTVHDVTRGDRQVAIVGVVTDTRDSQLTRTSPQIYVPFDQWPSASVRAFVRSSDPVARARDVQAVMRRSDPDVAIAELKSVRTMIDEELSSSRIINGLFVAFAVLALALAAAGLLGVISYSVGQRRREIGIRLALGAGPATVGRMIVTEGLKVVGWGIALGLVLAVLLARASRSLLFGITPGDPLTFGVVVAVIVVVAIVATLSPAARAMRIDPARTLRAD